MNLRRNREARRFRGKIATKASSQQQVHGTCIVCWGPNHCRLSDNNEPAAGKGCLVRLIFRQAPAATGVDDFFPCRERDMAEEWISPAETCNFKKQSGLIKFPGPHPVERGAGGKECLYDSAPSHGDNEDPGGRLTLTLHPVIDTCYSFYGRILKSVMMDDDIYYLT